MFLLLQASRHRRSLASCNVHIRAWISTRFNASQGLASSAAASKVEDCSVDSSKQASKTRSVHRKKAEIFTPELGKQPKIHLKPSLMSKSPPSGSKDAPAGRRRRGSSAATKKKSPEFSTAIQMELDEIASRSPPLPVEIEISPPPSRAEPREPAAAPSVVYDSEDSQRLRLELPEAVISAEAFFVARSVDLKALAMEPLLRMVMPYRNHVVIKLNETVSREDYTPMPGCLSNDKVAVIFQYGSVVFFNFHDLSLENNEIMHAVKRHSTEFFLGDPRKDNYRVVVIPGLDKWSQGGSDKIMVKKLDVDGIRIISLVLGQSIALDHYTRGIDEMLNIFGELNKIMELTGSFNMKRKALFKLVAAANAALADAILRLGLLERSDAAWQRARYDRIWEHMRGEFELDDRFESLEFKIGIIQHNVKFFLDILQNRKSDTLEWIIIILIAGEICVGVYDIARAI